MATLVFLILAILTGNTDPDLRLMDGLMDYTAAFILACIFIPLERLLPLHPEQRTLRRDWLNDVFYVLFNGFAVRAGFVVVATALMVAFTLAFGRNPLPWVAELPIWGQVLAVIVVADIGYYTGHRISHAVPFLWKFHAVHHSVEQMDWLASHRIHPVDMVFTNTLALMPVYFLGFSLEAIVIFQTLYYVHTLLIHSNTRINFGPLKWLIASPEYHHWHHANEPDAYDRNFSAQLSVIDVIAGTIFMPQKRRPVAYGLNEPMPRLYHQQFLHPFRGIARSFVSRTQQKDPCMTRKLEDDLGKLTMLPVFGYFGWSQVLSLVATVVHRDLIPLWPLALTSQLVATLFLSFVVYFTVTRLPPRDSAIGVLPRVTAVLGTFFMMVLVVLPSEAISPALRIASTVLIIVGTILSIICLARLGKSFSIMATSRRLVTSGPYRLVRHPLYAAELVLIVGAILSHGSPFAFAVGAVWLVLQIRRAQFEESVLRSTFPEYEDYAARVPMLVPGLRLPWLEALAPTVQKPAVKSESA